jgi:membrane protein required for colicin V production
LTVFDYFVLAVIGASVVIGLVRGGVRELLGLAAWVLAFIVAKDYAAEVAPMIGEIADPSTRLIAAFIATFLATLVVAKLLTLAVASLFGNTPLGPLDRLLGMIVGVARGVLIIVVVVLVAGFTTLPKQHEWRHALSIGWFEALAGSVRALMPEDMWRRLGRDHAPV